MATPPDFSVGQVLTAANMNAVGLWLVKTQTVGSGVSSVTVTGAFSADYDNYKIIYTGYTGSASPVEPLKLRLGATATGYYGNAALFEYTSTALVGVNDNNQTFFRYVGGSSTAGSVTDIDLHAPFLASRTYIRANNVNYSTFANGTYGGFLDNSTSYTDFTITAFTTGTFSGGTIRVYGYRK
jgi:hypothetical protein